MSTIQNNQKPPHLLEHGVMRRVSSSMDIIQGLHCDIIDVEVPLWYDKGEAYDYLIRHNYSKEIATELSEKWANDQQGAFRKGFELGFRHAKGEHVDAVITVR